VAVTLHEEIERVLGLRGGGPAGAQQIADAVNASGRYSKHDGSRISAQQIHARVSKHPETFERTPDGIRLRNGASTRPASSPQAGGAASTGVLGTEPWYWEGNVQAALASHLLAGGWKVEQTANTATRERGIDLVATKGARRMAVEVKGYPATVYARGPKAGQPKPTAPTNQARHWFGQALLAAIVTEGFPNRALAFPDFPRYRELIRRSSWALRALEIDVYLVAEDGSVDLVSRG
jgi:hypothetical protein